MAKGQSSFHDSIRLGRPKPVSADTDIVELRKRYATLWSRFGAPPADAKFAPAQIGSMKGEWARLSSSWPGRVILYFHGGGYGAGGGRAFAVLHAARIANLPMPAVGVAMSPWADLSLSGWAIMQNAKTDSALSWDLLFVSARHYLKKTNPADPKASPMFANFKDFPPIKVHANSLEMLKDDASRLGDRAADANVPVSIEIYDGMQHVFQGSRNIPEAKASLQRLGQFIRSGTSHQANAAQ